MLSRQMLALGSRLYEGLVAVRDAAKLYELGEGVHCRALLDFHARRHCEAEHEAAKVATAGRR